MVKRKSRKQKKRAELVRRYRKRRRRQEKRKDSDLDSVRIAFSGYEKLTLLSKIAGLSLLPENQGRNVRLEIAQRMACVAESGHTQITSSKLASILGKHLPNSSVYALQEDPDDSLFTENLIFHGGNYVLYPGISEAGVYILQTILNAIFRTKNELPDTFKKLIYSTSLLVLNISNNVVKRLNHQRNMEPCKSGKKALHVPPAKTLDELARACIFTKGEITLLLQRFDLDEAYLKPFLLSFNDKKLSQGLWDNNPIDGKPLCRIEDNIVLLQPSSLACALRHFIFVKAVEDGLVEKLYSCLRDAAKHNVTRNLDRLGYSNVDFQLAEPNGKMDYVDELIYRFDINKICYVQIITDDLVEYDTEIVYGNRERGNIGKELQIRQHDVNARLLIASDLGCENVLNLVVMSGVGRWYHLGFDKGIENTFLLSLSDENLDVAVKMGECESLTFWKVARSFERFLDKHPRSFPLNSFLDIFGLYLDHGNSFTISDDNLAMASIQIGYGNGLRIKARKSLDTHAAKIGEGLTIVHKRYSEGNIPIYFSEDFALSYRLVEGYDIPIWIIPEGNGKANIRESSFYVSFSEMLAYWIWQMSPSLEGCINNLPLDSLNIYFEFDDIGKWTDENFYNDSDAELTFRISSESICLTIPIKCKEVLSRSDNEGEKDILVKLVGAIAGLCVALNCEEPFDDKEIEAMVNSYADNTFKKMILMHTANRASLHPEHVPKLRLLQGNDQDDQLEGLANLLVKNRLPVGPIASKPEQLNVLREVVEIYHERLRDEVRNFSYKELLPLLISYQESIWQQRAQNFLHWPARLACFQGEADFIEKEIERMYKVNGTSIGLRFLIEFISAEPPEGNARLSLDAYDRLVAISFEFINWATHYDQLQNDLFESELSILPNGRIGRAKEYMEEFKNVFGARTIQESIDISRESFDDVFRKGNDRGPTTDSRIEDALLDEYGMGWGEICDFHNALTSIGFEKKVPCVTMPHDEFVKTLRKRLDWSNKKLNLAIENFSLTQREKWEVPPKGYDFYKDVAPWRYKRRLSYVLRCLVRVERGKKNTSFYWGPRHAEESLRYLAELVGRGQYRARSQKMIKLNGEIQKEIGDRFNERAYTWFKENSDFIVEKKIKVSSFARSEKDFGDIDLLLVDKENKRIYSFECKYLYSSRNAREMASELERLVDDSGEKSWTTRHLERHQAIEDNLGALLRMLRIQEDPYKLYSAILTSEEIPSVYLAKMPISFINLMGLKRNGLMELDHLL